jgi:hypothetical protein
MANGRQPQPVLSSPMDTNKPATMPSGYPRPAFLSPSEKDAQEKEKWSAYGANRVAPAGFEIALTGLTGMQKRNARRALAMEEATFQRNQGRAAIEQANIDARDAAKQADATAAAQEWWKQQQQIGQNFDMARENRNIGNTSALNAAKDKEAEDAKRRPVQAVPVLLPDGTVSKGYYGANNMILPFQTVEPKALRVEPGAAKALLSSPQASTLDANTLAEIVSDTRYDIATRELARRQLAKPKTAPEERRYIDPDNYRPFTLKPGERLPEGSRLVPLTPEAAPAPTGQQDPAALRQKYGYGK